MGFEQIQLYGTSSEDLHWRFGLGVMASVQVTMKQVKCRVLSRW